MHRASAPPVSFPGHLGAAPVVLDQPRVWELKHWRWLSDQQRVAFLRNVSESSGRDPRIRNLAAQILRNAGVQERDYIGQCRAILKWVQPGGGGGISYLNEPDEILQDPLYTIKTRQGDCDDLGMLVNALFTSIRLDNRFVLSGAGPRGPVRWIEGMPFTRAKYSHVYACVAWPPFAPANKQTWAFVEPTVRNAPLGWDVLQAKRPVLPEMAQRAMSGFGSAFGALVPLGGASWGAPTLSLSALTGGAVAGEIVENAKRALNPVNIITAAVTGVTVTVVSQLFLDYIRRRFIRK